MFFKIHAKLTLSMFIFILRLAELDHILLYMIIFFEIIFRTHTFSTVTVLTSNSILTAVII